MPDIRHIFRCAPAAVLLLAACGQSADQPQPAPTPSGTYLAQIAALNPAQLDMVLFRAVRDAGQDCQDVTKAERLADPDGRALWRVTCRGGGQFAVAIGADGVANVTAPHPR